MRLTKFEITNFKGISKTTINLSDEIPGNVVTLIGLNESGKTTILEALSHFVTEDKETASLVGTVQQKSGLQDIIPKDRKAAFSGRVSIKATIILDTNDKKVIAEKFMLEHSMSLDIYSMNSTVILERAYLFEDSAYKETNTYWTVTFPLKDKSKRKYTNYVASGDTRTLWLAGVDYVKSIVPRVVFFPTFLFNFPERIYLEGNPESEINEYYKQVMQDVLDSQGDELSVQKHIVDRIKKRRDGYANPALFLSYFFGLDEKSQIDAVMQKISNEMSKVIFGAWSDILGRVVSNKRVQVDWFVDAEKKNLPYLQVSIIDGQSRYALSERSLGFRWFFSFLLFTQFRKNRKYGTETIFLFDEPAANLHSKAQMRLLESLTKIANSGTYIIYSTHSHYMVNPFWLEKAYIIDNKANDYDDEDQVDSFSVKKTDIYAVKYRAFVAKYPTKTTYFQPVLDALDVVYSPLDRAANALIIEGKFDYHPFAYLRSRLNNGEGPQIFPANGAGSMGLIISLFRGWGTNFRILLDDDQAGRESKKRYIKDYLLTGSQVITIGDISGRLKGKTFESVYQADVLSAAQSHFQLQKIGKRQFSLLFQDLIARKASVEFPATEEAFSEISSWVDREFSGIDD